MSHKQAKRERKLGLPEKPKQLFAPLTFTVKGEEVFYPRVQRRKMLRAFTKAIRTGKISMADVIKQRRENEKGISRPDVQPGQL